MPSYHAESDPDLLSAWGQVDVVGGELVLGEGVLPYDLNTPLFTDYAHKLRTIWVPEGTALYREGDVLNFPVGTVISKTFYYPIDGADVVRTASTGTVTATRGLDLATHRLIETRLLVRRAAGWSPVSYVWDGNAVAHRKRIGAVVPLSFADWDDQDDLAARTFAYLVPNTNQCAGCHAPNNTTRTITPIGPKPRHLNRDYAYASGVANQVDHLVRLGWLDGVPDTAPRLADWTDPQAPLPERARAYLDVNCAHCHNRVGPADTSGLWLDTQTEPGPHLGLCKRAVAAGSGTGGRLYDIVPGASAESILVHRMETTDPGAMMPELGRALRHDEGVALIADWVDSLSGGCDS